MLFFTICAFVGFDTLGIVASNGGQGFTWLIVLAVAFVLPYALLMSEVGSAFTQEGGPYEWSKLAFGRFSAAIAAVYYWITNPLWVGGSLAFIATAAWVTTEQLPNIGTGTVGDYAFKLAFIWFSIIVAIASLRYGKWIPTAGAFMRIAVLGFFSLTVVIYAFAWVAIFPGTIERWADIPYDFEDAWGLSRARFEAFTLGTLGVITLLAVVGYALGAPVRRRQVDVPLEADEEPAT